MKQTTYKNSSNDNEIADDYKMLQSLKKSQKTDHIGSTHSFSND